MTFLRTFLLITVVSAGHLAAQQKPEETPAPAVTNTPALVSAAPVPPETNSVPPVPTDDALVTKDKGNSTSAAPQVEPAAQNEFWRGTSQFLNSFNPFAPVETRPGSVRVAGESSRAWTTTVGWNPGGSAFPDALTHESQLSVISVRSTRKP